MISGGRPRVGRATAAAVSSAVAAAAPRAPRSAAPAAAPARSAATAAAPRPRSAAAAPRARSAATATAAAAAPAPAARARAASSAAAASSSSSLGPPLTPCTVHSDGKPRCWGVEFTDAAQREYHDATWGRVPSGAAAARLLYKQFILQSFQAGLSWAIVLKKEPGFARRFHGYDYERVAKWGDADVAAALADAGIIRNKAKVEAAVANARVAVALDKTHPGGFLSFCWAVAGGLPAAERLLQHGSRSGTWMRADAKTDYTTADGVHPTRGVMEVVDKLKRAGFKFLGPAATLSWLQAAGFVNHHKPDCVAFGPAEASYAKMALAQAGAGGAAAAAGAGGGRATAGGAGGAAPVAAPRKRAASAGAGAGAAAAEAAGAAAAEAEGGAAGAGGKKKRARHA